MRIFDTNVQFIKYQVLKEVIRRAYEGGLDEAYTEIPKLISPGPKATMRCCIYKERAITQERVKMAMGGHRDNPNSVEVIDVACDECPIDGMYVTPACRGCIVHKCKEVCPRGAISIIDKKCVIDKEKCIECGLCTKACPYSAIIPQHRPCVQSCKVKALSVNEDKKAVIDNDKCVSCGACVYACPFGAIVDKSLIMEVINILKESENNTNYKVYAVIAPAIVSQIPWGKISQVATAIKKLGFHQVVEAALGADITLYHEANEWKERKIMTTSCCPSFVMYIEKNFPKLTQFISSSPSPMIETAQLIKKSDPTAKVVFIGPCTSKKLEYKRANTHGMIDSVLSFEELQAFVDARGIDTSTLEESQLDNASFYGRIFAKSGGVTRGVADVAASMGIEGVKPLIMNGLTECKKNLTLLNLGKIDANFFEGMACEGGCINGALCITHGAHNLVDVDNYGNQAKEKTIDNSVKLYKLYQGNDQK